MVHLKDIQSGKVGNEISFESFENCMRGLVLPVSNSTLHLQIFISTNLKNICRKYKFVFLHEYSMTSHIVN